MTLIMSTMERRGRGRQPRFVSLRYASHLAILAIVFSAAAHAAGANMPGVGARGFEGKMQYCQDCHGISGQGYRGFVPIPRLAGQQPEYLKNQLQAFVEHRRPNNIMSNIAHVLSPAMITALGTRFKHLDPKPLGGAPRQHAAAGEAIFQDGVPDANVAACAACHGPDAHGHEEIPRLAGQLYPYIVKALTNWGKERGQNPATQDTSAIMEPVAHSLTKPQVEAVAAYLSNLK